MADKAAVFLLVTILLLVTIIIVFAMKYFAATRQARLRITSEASYRELAERTVQAQEKSAESLAALKSGMSQIETRLTSVEKVLKEVE
jgi:signal transduction histidine kinase